MCFVKNKLKINQFMINLKSRQINMFFCYGSFCLNFLLFGTHIAVFFFQRTVAGNDSGDDSEDDRTGLLSAADPRPDVN